MQNIFDTNYDFITTRDMIQKELLNYLPGGDLPHFFTEKGVITIVHKDQGITNDKIPEFIKILKKQIENIRIHSADDGYLCLQALNDNIYDSKSLLDNIKFRFFTNHSSRLEITKNGNLNSNEMHAVIGLIAHISQNAHKNFSPDKILTGLGVSVYKNAEENPITFADLAGYANVKEEIIESVILPLKNIDMFEQISSFTRKNPSKNIPRAILFDGEPGVGKTSFAKAAANMAGIPLIYIPVETILSKYYGESAKKLALVFDSTDIYPSSILFLDEIDSLVGNRDDGMFEATRNVLSVLLRKLDGIGKKQNSILIAATNRKQDLDRALLSRFDRNITFQLPDHPTRAAILSQYALHLTKEQNLELAGHLVSFSGRSIRDFCDFVERKWAVRIIENNLKICPPEFGFYLELALKKV